MLREFNRLAREMLFLHGHLTRPSDWVQSPATDATPGGLHVTKRPAKRSRARRLAMAAAACGMVTPIRLITGQIR